MPWPARAVAATAAPVPAWRRAPAGPRAAGGQQECRWSLLRPCVSLCTRCGEWGRPVPRASAGGFSPQSSPPWCNLASPSALGLILRLRKMVSTSMPRCAWRCYDNECILKTNTSRWHIADKPTPNVSRPTCRYYRCSACGPGGWLCPGAAGADGQPDPLSDPREPSFCVGWFRWPVGVGATGTSCSPTAPRHSLATCNVNVGSDAARHSRCLPWAGRQAWVPVLTREDGCGSPQAAEVLLESLRGRGSLW